MWKHLISHIFKKPIKNFNFEDEMIKKKLDAMDQNMKIKKYIDRAHTYGVKVLKHGRDSGFQEDVDAYQRKLQTEAINVSIRLSGGVEDMSSECTS